MMHSIYSHLREHDKAEENFRKAEKMRAEFVVAATGTVTMLNSAFRLHSQYQGNDINRSIVAFFRTMRDKLCASCLPLLFN